LPDKVTFEDPLGEGPPITLEKFEVPDASEDVELRRRKVIRTGVAYLGAAFIVLQAADLTFEPLGLPRWSYTLVVAIALGGLPVALLLSWAFDFTAYGIRRTADAQAAAATVTYSPAGGPCGRSGTAQARST